MPMKPTAPARPWQACVGAGLRRNDVGLGEAACDKYSVIPAQAGIHASFSACDAGGRSSRRKRPRSACALAALVISATLFDPSIAAAQRKPDTAGVATQEIEVRARPIAGFAKNGGAPRLSPRLAWRGGLELASFSTHFGGWSGLVLGKDGKSLVAVSDSGIWMTGELTYDGVRPSGISSARIGPLRTRKGDALTRQRDRDAEAIALASGTPTNGKVYIGFERNSRIGLFDIGKEGLDGPSAYMAMPPGARRMRNEGIEALTVLAGGPRKGALVAFAESPPRGETLHRGWIWVSGKPQPFSVAAGDGYGITDAASLADGSVLIIERRFRWLEGLRVRLRLLAADGIEPGGTAAGEILLEAGNGNAEIDNLEALALSEDEDGGIVVTLMSDDNFNRFLQRTVLLQFTLKAEPAAEAAARAARAAAP
jgi:hypothetical protein